jgi:serralysin
MSGTRFKELVSIPSVVVALTMLLGAASAGCSAGDAGGYGESVAAADNVPLVEWETYRASAKVVPDGLLVEWDLLFPDEEELYAYWQEHYAGGPGQGLTVNRIKVNGVERDDVWAYPQRLDLTYCVGSGFDSTQLTQLLPALDAAAEEWSRIAGVRHRRVTTSGTCNENDNSVVFDVRGVTNAGWLASAFYPGNERAKRTLKVDSSAFTHNELGMDLRQILLHELGHTLGFRHEHIWLQSHPDGCLEAVVSPFPRLLSPTYDEDSVMFYYFCRTPPGGGYQLSMYDINGVVSLYGLAPALINAISPSID